MQMGSLTPDADLWQHPFIVEAVRQRDAGLMVRAWRWAQWPTVPSQARTARRLGMSQGTLSWHETGKGHPSDDQRTSWFRELGVPRRLWWWTRDFTAMGEGNWASVPPGVAQRQGG